VVQSARNSQDGARTSIPQESMAALIGHVTEHERASGEHEGSGRGEDEGSGRGEREGVTGEQQ
jgi:hypothetical protein